jgi:hypothetical protein
MSWTIQCQGETCGKVTVAAQIDDLVTKHIDALGWFRCSHCGDKGYIQKSYTLQEGTPWVPFLKGVILLEREEVYHPFVFLVSTAANKNPQYTWFCYYKDTRHLPGGRLKLGHGPGGPPTVGLKDLYDLPDRLRERNCLPVA